MLLVSLLNLETLSFDNRLLLFLPALFVSIFYHSRRKIKKKGGWGPRRKKGEKKKGTKNKKNVPRESCSISLPGSFISEQAKPSSYLNRDVMNDAHFCNSQGANIVPFLFFKVLFWFSWVEAGQWLSFLL